MRYFIEFSYNGKNYHGWQKQLNANTVQEELTKRLSTFLRQDIDLVGAGRTDTGVHAKKMYAHFDVLLDINKADFTHKINTFLPVDILINDIFLTNDNAHARFDAEKRTYQYFISTKKEVFNENTYSFLRDLDLKMMNKGCEYLLGKQDFSSFSKSNTETEHNICHVMEAKWQKKDDYLIFTITSNRFLRNMVRSIVGTLLEVGLGRINSKEILMILNKKDRSSAGFSVPAKGLFLTEIIYPKEILK